VVAVALQATREEVAIAADIVDDKDPAARGRGRVTFRPAQRPFEPLCVEPGPIRNLQILDAGT
jgi:hypothetical protein